MFTLGKNYSAATTGVFFLSFFLFQSESQTECVHAATHQRQSNFEHWCQRECAVEQRDTVHTQDGFTVTLLLLLFRLLGHQQPVHGVVRILGGVQQHFTVRLACQLNRHVDEKIAKFGGEGFKGIATAA